MTRLFCNARIPTSGNDTRVADFLVESGRFAWFADPGEGCRTGAQEVDLREALVLPGVIDGHVHFDDPGYTWRETFETGTRAAAAGGVTCVADMPCTSVPPVVNVDALRRKLDVIAPKAHVDFLCWGGVCANLIEEGEAWRGQLRELAEAGIGAIKCYLLSGMKSFRALSPDQLTLAAEACGALGLPLGVHAEDHDFVTTREAALRASGADGPAAFLASRPGEVERLAALTMIRAARETGARLHVVHLGSGAALDEITSAREQGLRVSAETCPQYLAFTAADFNRLGSLLKTAPPVKEESDRQRLWSGVERGDIDFVATDHAAGEWPREKNTGSFWTDYGGIPGVELLLPWLWTAGVRGGRITLERLTELLSAAPARFFGIARRKGALAQGQDADFVVLEEMPWTVRAADLHCLNRYSPFEGMELSIRVRQTWLRGELAFDEGSQAFPAGMGHGRFTPREERDA